MSSTVQKFFNKGTNNIKYDSMGTSNPRKWLSDGILGL